MFIKYKSFFKHKIKIGLVTTKNKRIIYISLY